MTEEWLQREMHQRLNALEEKVSKIEVTLEQAAQTAKTNSENLQELLALLKFQRWMLRSGYFCVGFFLWATGQINFDQISSVVDTLSTGPK